MKRSLSLFESEKLLDEILDLITDSMNPSDVFSEEQLREWAEQNGYVDVASLEMLLTLEEAKTKWCPMVRASTCENDGNASNCGIGEKYRAMNWSCCIADACAMWRWAKDPGNPLRPLRRRTDEKWTCKYCGGTGKSTDPEDGFCPECEGQGAGHKYVQIGFCGLSGRAE